MPPKHVARPRGRARRSQAKRILSRALDIEEPLREARDFIHALQQIGNGVMSMSEDEGRPIVAVARAAGERLDRLHEAWVDLVRAARG